VVWYVVVVSTAQVFVTVLLPWFYPELEPGKPSSVPLFLQRYDQPALIVLVSSYHAHAVSMDY